MVHPDSGSNRKPVQLHASHGGEPHHGHQRGVSLDERPFHLSYGRGASDEDGTRVTFVRGEPVEGMVTVTATINGTPTDRIFVVLVVTQVE